VLCGVMSKPIASIGATPGACIIKLITDVINSVME